jgi:hypothetical protein
VIRKRSSLGLGLPRALLFLGLPAVFVGLLVWQLLPRDDTSEVSVGQALAEFRRLADRDPGRAAPAAELPHPGVYSYAVSGGERLDALLDADHTYPATTPIVVSRGGCGVEERWQALDQRWAAAGICPAAGEPRLAWVREYHDFFGEPRTTVYRCVAVSANATRCDSAEGTVSYSSRQLGRERVAVGSESVVAEHTLSRIVLSGDSSGSARSEEWRRVGDGLLLRKRFALIAGVGSAGGARYEESYVLKLRSTDPRR